MRKHRILVVDDSVVMRRMLREIISEDPDLEVAGVAANGRIALAMIEQLSPDAVTLDIEMPEMGGIEALEILRPKYPALRVIVFSSLSTTGAVATLDALQFGADDYVTKPVNVSNLAEGMERIRSQLLPRLKALCLRPRQTLASVLQSNRSLVPSSANREIQRLPVPRLLDRIDILAIGTSTGGPNALADVLARLPADLPVPILIVQHMPPMFTRLLAERLTATSKIPVAEAFPGAILSPGKAWIAPGDCHMLVRSTRAGLQLDINQQPPENSCRPSVDVLFRSVADVFGAHTLAVVMTGMGQDGLHGCEAIHDKGGQILAQDEATSVVWGMPGFVSKAGLADRTLPLLEIGAEIVRRVSLRNPTSSTPGLPAKSEAER